MGFNKNPIRWEDRKNRNFYIRPKYIAFWMAYLHLMVSMKISCKIIKISTVIYRRPGSVSETKEKQYSAVPVAEAETMQVLIP